MLHWSFGKGWPNINVMNFKYPVNGKSYDLLLCFYSISWYYIFPIFFDNIVFLF